MPASIGRLVGPHAVALVTAAAVGVRLPLLNHAPSADEGGFLAVGAQWHAGGSSLYGNYWVDRPPLLITIFRWAAQTGGLVPLRLIGALATALIVLGVAHVARQLGGPRAAGWGALAAGALCVSPLLGTTAVNGELLSEPFVIWGIALTLHGLSHREGLRTRVYAAGAGAALVTALLIKQNIADVGVFAVAATAIAWRRGEVTTPQVRQFATAFVLGAGGCLVATSAWTLLHGTSLTGVFYALYPFRLEAARVMAASANQAHIIRFWMMVISWAVSGGAIVLAITAWALITRRMRGTAVWALAVTIGFEIVSVVMGGNYWSHYLVQLIGPLSVLAGLLAARHQLHLRALLPVVALVAAATWAAALPWEATTVSSSVGESIGDVALPGDTIVTVYGHASVTQSSGLVSPYPYLWSLPSKTLDPDQRLLDHVLNGPSAPTWFVAWRHVSSWGVRSATTSHLIARDYHRAAVLHGHTIYLHNGIDRAPPALAAQTPTTRPPITSGLKELVP